MTRRITEYLGYNEEKGFYRKFIITSHGVRAMSEATHSFQKACKSDSLSTYQIDRKHNKLFVGKFRYDVIYKINKTILNPKN